MDIKYENKTRDYNIYTEEFFGGSDVSIYIDGVKVDIAYVQFSVQENLKPLYGYKSRTFDDVAVGNRIVIGTIKVPVTNNISENVMKENEEVLNQTITVPSYIYTSDSIDNSKENSYNYDVNGKVYEYQNILKNLGYEVLSNGILDKNTKIAINDFMRDKGLPICDYFSSEVVAALTGATQSKYKVAFQTKLKYGPGDKFNDMQDTLYPNTVVSLIEDYDNEWSKIQIDNLTKGYIKKSLLRKV